MVAPGDLEPVLELAHLHHAPLHPHFMDLELRCDLDEPPVNRSGVLPVLVIFR